MNVSKDALRRQWGLPSTATDAEIKAAIQSGPPLALRPLASRPSAAPPRSQSPSEIARRLGETLRKVEASIARGDRVITDKAAGGQTVSAASGRPGRPQQLEAEHRALMQSQFPTVAHRLGYAAPQIPSAWLMGDSHDSWAPYAPPAIDEPPPVTFDASKERQHRAFMASNFPAASRARSQRRSRIHEEHEEHGS